MKTLAGDWVEGKTQGEDLHRQGWKPRRGPKTKWAKYLHERARSGFTVKAFVEKHRTHRSPDCLFVPYAIDGRPAKVLFCGKGITAARYMALLTMGAPKYANSQVRHLCGNGHLSCINPQHLRWGFQSDNHSDMVKHRQAETVQEKIAVIDGKL